MGTPVELLLASDLRNQQVGTRVETVCIGREGREIPVEVHVGSIDGPERFLVVTLRDMTELQAGREARFEAEAKYRTLVEQIPAVVYLDPVDENKDSIYVSPQITDLLGIEPADWLGDPYCWRSHVHVDDIDRVWQEYEDAYRTHVPLNHEYRMVHEDGTIKWVMEQAFPIDDGDGEPWLIQGVIFDITQRKTAEEEIAFLAYHDKLTGLPNRALFEEMLESALARARRFDHGVGVLFLDLDNFKLVNDSLGHHAGDQLLIQLAERLRVCTRETDTVARLSGDEFLLLLADLERGAGAPDAALLIAESVAARVREALEQPFDLGGSEFLDASLAALEARLAPLEEKLAGMDQSDAEEAARAEAREIADQLAALKAAAAQTELFSDRLAVLEATLPRLNAAQSQMMRALERQTQTRQAQEERTQEPRTQEPQAPGLPAPTAAAEAADPFAAFSDLPRVVSLHQQ